MRNILTSLPSWLSRQNRLQPTSWLALFLLTLSLTALGNRAAAQTPANAPQQLKNVLARIDAAANQRNVNAVMQFYGQNFTHSDGLTRQSMAQALTQVWQRYPQLKYQTQLQSWKPEGKGIVAETVTNITGAQTQDSRNLVLNATIRSRQWYENNQIVRQEILSERSLLKAGTQPPTVDLKLPQQVKPGQQYNFDAIVQEPLGEDYLLGAAIEEPIKPENYLNPKRVELELLSAGGLFKLGRAPAQPDDRWISAVLIRGDGMTMVTQRLHVVGQNRPPNPSPTKK
ncbi:nuclear transport factor 2 family protein [Chroococcidiopsis sp. CCMEE 29]|uniref:nuclear transport factor 2 family protein n=1 Tax=Chroococcidiopsis sp. CCMEE 29 TaxID=155894 RepID=UPI002021DF06|nr:nuclear transport factor 2 family protein [Chroococcidiopsis sp. CCMEE 29]